jgi:hypothetical protein
MLSEDFYEFRKRNFEDRLEKDKIISILNNDTTRETTSECFESCEDLFSDSKSKYLFRHVAYEKRFLFNCFKWMYFK